MQVGSESPWRAIQSVDSLYGQRRTIGQALTPATRAGLLQALETIDQSGLHLYQDKSILKITRRRQLSPQQALAFVEGESTWFRCNRLTVSHDGQSHFPVFYWRDLYNLQNIALGCAAAGIAAPQLVAAMAGLSEHGIRLYRFQSSDDGHEPLEPFRFGHDGLRRVGPPQKNDSPINCDLEQIIAMDYLQGSGVDRGLRDPALAKAVKQAQESGHELSGWVGDGGPTSAYLALLRGRPAFATPPPAPHFPLTRELVLDETRYGAYVDRWHGLFARHFSGISDENHRGTARHLMERAMREDNPEEAASCLACLHQIPARGDRSSGPPPAVHAYDLICQLAPTPAMRGQVAEDLVNLCQSFAKECGAGPCERCQTKAQDTLRQLYAAPPNHLPPLREAVHAVEDKHPGFFMEPAHLSMLTEASEEAPLAARCQLLRTLSGCTARDDKLVADFQLMLQSKDGNESLADAWAQFQQMHDGLTESDRGRAPDIFRRLGEAVGRGEVTVTEAVPLFLNRYVLARDPDLALQRLSAPPAADIQGIQQSVHEVVLNGVRVSRNLGS